MKKLFIVLLILATVSHLFADENSAFQWQPFRNHLEFVAINPNTIFLKDTAHNPFTLFEQNTREKIPNQNRPNNTVAVQNATGGAVLLGVGIAAAVITGEMLLGNYYNDTQPDMSRQFEAEWKRQQELEKAYQRMRR